MARRILAALFILAVAACCSLSRPQLEPIDAVNAERHRGSVIKNVAPSASHQVALVYAGYGAARNGYFCAGSLIAPNWVITAAHCLSARTTPAEVQVAAGSAQLSESEIIDVTEVIRHERFDRNRMTDDIALLHLARAPVCSRPVALADFRTENQALSRHLTARASGWGARDAEVKEVSDALLFVDLPMVDAATCKASYGDAVTESMVCAGDRRRDVCSGDSGGGLTVTIGGRTYLEGIVSWGGECGAGRPGVYTRVPAYAAWIIEHVGRGKEE